MVCVHNRCILGIILKTCEKIHLNDIYLYETNINEETISNAGSEEKTTTRWKDFNNEW